MIARVMFDDLLRRATCVGALAIGGYSGVGASEIQFVAPRPLSTVVGSTEVTLRIEVPPELNVLRVELAVDDVPLTAMAAPPWTVEWDAGDGSRGHTLAAVAYLSDGTTRAAWVRTSRLRINAVEEVDLVSLYAVVRDPDGNYVYGLGRDGFTLLEDGREQTIKVFSEQPRPLSVGIVLDASTSMVGRKLVAAKEAARAFLRLLSPIDQATVVAFADEAQVLEELTPVTSRLAAAIEGLEAAGATAFYDAVWLTTEALCESDSRRVIVLLSDGRDEAPDGRGPGSRHSFEDALEYAQRCEVMIFAIGFGADLSQLDHEQRRTQAATLTLLGTETGGRVLFPTSAGVLRRTFKAVAQDLRHQYAIAYTSNNDTYDGNWREIRLVPRDDELTVATRTGYFAHDDGRSSRSAETNTRFEIGMEPICTYP